MIPFQSGKGLPVVYMAPVFRKVLLTAWLWFLFGSFLCGQVCSLSSEHTDAECFGESTGSINIAVTGGVEPYHYLWTGPGSFTSTNQDLTGLASGSYSVTVTDAGGICNNTATIIVGQPERPMEFSDQPPDQTDCYGNTVEFPAQVDGFVGAVNYQWQSRPPEGEFSDITGEISPDLVVHDIGVNGQNIHGTEYRLIASDDCTTITSGPALLEINTVTGLTGFVNLTICSGNVTFYEVSVRGNVTGYQWSFNDGTGWVNITDGSIYSGTNSSRLTIADAIPEATGGYRVSVSFSTLNQPEGYPECVVTTHTRNRNLMVLPPLVPPVVSSGQTFCHIGTPYPLTATPTSGGSGPDYSYQWQISTDGVNWTDVPGAVSLLYSPPALTATTLYRIMATDEGPLRCGVVHSYPVTITVNPMPLTSAIFHN